MNISTKVVKKKTLSTLSPIIKISAGVVIGLLVYQIIIFQKTDIEYEQGQKDVMAEQELRNKYILLTNSLHSYYKKYKELPEFVADLSCIDVFNDRREIPCGTIQKDGVFYVNNNNDWASAEPYVFDKKLYIKCSSSIKFLSVISDYKDCADLDISTLPEREPPAFDCSAELNTVQKLICSSDRLTAIDNRLAQFYDELQSKSNEDRKREIRDDKNKFVNRRLSECVTSKCVEKMTKDKITRLELLGVYKK